jgi:hypothetical protein
MTDRADPSPQKTSQAAATHLEVVRSKEADSPAAAETQVPKRRTATKRAIWRAWTGTLEDLHKINKRFVELVQSRRAALARELPGGYARDERLKDLLPQTVLVTKAEETVSGPFDEVVGEVDPRTWDTLTFRAGSEYRGELLHLNVRRQPDRDGAVVELTIKSADPGWAASSVARMSELLELGKPRWSWLHTTWAPPLLTFITYMLLLVAPQVAIAPWRSSSPFALGIAVVCIVLVSVCAVVSSLTLGHRLVRRMVPPSEIRYDHTPQSSGSRFIGSLLAVWIIPILIAVVTILLTGG